MNSRQTINQERTLIRRRIVKDGSGEPNGPFPFKQDGAAKHAYRNRRPATGLFVLRQDFPDFKLDFEHFSLRLESIGRQYGTFIQPPGSCKERQMPIWGEQQNVLKTKAALHNWLGTSTQRAGSGKSDRFGHDRSTDSYLFIREERVLLKAAAARAYQRLPGPEKTSLLRQSFPWPMDEVNPRDIFGHNLEAFDIVRTKNKCHITFDESNAAFELYASLTSRMDKASASIAGALKAFRLRNQRKETVYTFVLGHDATPDLTVCYLDGQGARIGNINGRIPRLTKLSSLDSKSVRLARQESQATAIGDTHLSAALGRAISSLVYLRGNVQMRVHFGIFALTEFPRHSSDTSCNYAHFLQATSHGNITGSLVRSIGPKPAGQMIVERLLDDKIYLWQTGERSVSNLARNTFVSGRFATFNMDQTPIQLSKHFGPQTGDDDTLYTTNSIMWTCGRQHVAQILLEAFEVDLEGDCSWLLRISDERQLDISKTTPDMKSFEASVQVDQVLVTDAFVKGINCFVFEDSTALEPLEFEQKISLRFRLFEATDWIFEISRFDRFRLRERTSQGTTWSVSMWNILWDETLAENAILVIGDKAGWTPSLSTFFNNVDKDHDNDGLKQFRTRMAGARRFIRHLVA